MASPEMASPEAKQPPLTSSPYPYAAAPDIIRAHQKDLYFQGVLTNQLSDLHRRLLGARSAHAWAAEARTAADALYLSLTTLVGNRTLGEEYCDLVQIEEPLAYTRHTHRGPASTTTPTISTSPTTQTQTQTPGPSETPTLPSLPRRAALLATSTLAPYLASLLLPRLRRSLRARLQSRLDALARQGQSGTRPYRVRRYLLAHLAELTSPSHAQALTLAVFYFTGAYYSLAKRVLGLRYVFTTARRDGGGGGGTGAGGPGDRVGYEVLGVLLVVQMAVRAWLHLRATLSERGTEAEAEAEAAVRERVGAASYGREVSLDANSYGSSNNELLGGGGGPTGGQRSLQEIGATTHTPVVGGGRARFDLDADEKAMGWIKGRQQRLCTLCLEGLRDPAATPCGHVFCWTCIGDWVREKPECPLCRREALVQHILPLRTG